MVHGQWIYGPVQLDAFHPGYFLPTVAGGLIASAGAAEVGQRRLAEVMLGLGIICWLLLGSIILARLLFRPLPPAPLLHTLAIEVAPAAVASVAYFALNGGRIDTVAAFLGGYGLLMVLDVFILGSNVSADGAKAPIVSDSDPVRLLEKLRAANRGGDVHLVGGPPNEQRER